MERHRGDRCAGHRLEHTNHSSTTDVTVTSRSAAPIAFRSSASLGTAVRTLTITRRVQPNDALVAAVGKGVLTHR